MIDSKRPYIFLSFLLLFCVALRLSTLGTLALSDPSEGRYATIAQTMYLSGNWITPQTFDDGVVTPFLGKPPLHFWLTALSYKLFGMTEFASRLPSFLATVLLAATTFGFAWVFVSSEVAFLATFILLGSVIGFFLGGSCMTDPLLAAVTSGALLSYALAVRSELPSKKVASYLFFVFLALGLLCKGPIAIVLVGITLAPWILLQRDRSRLFRLPWIGGVSLMLLIAAPWYILAEIENPGFLRYFLINENFLRFLVRNYGDKYGSSHVKPYGTVWLLALAAMCPWSLLLPFFVRRWRSACDLVRENEWVRFALLWGAAPCLFFTISRQVSFAYVLPGVPGFSVLLGALLVRLSQAEKERCNRYFTAQKNVMVVASIAVLSLGALLWLGAISAFALFGILVGFLLLNRRCYAYAFEHGASGLALAATASVILFTLSTVSLAKPFGEKLSSKLLVQHLEEGSTAPIEQVTFIGKIPQSAYFYLREDGNEDFILSLTPTVNELPVSGYVAATPKQWRKLSPEHKKSYIARLILHNWILFSGA